jgi:probable phosphoglycerate mutase
VTGHARRYAETRTDPDGYAARQADAWNRRLAGGESYRMLPDRVALRLAEADRDAVVVSHGGVSRALRGLVLRLAGPEILRLGVPQDKVLLVQEGGIRWL